MGDGLWMWFAGLISSAKARKQGMSEGSEGSEGWVVLTQRVRTFESVFRRRKGPSKSGAGVRGDSQCRTRIRGSSSSWSTRELVPKGCVSYVLDTLMRKCRRWVGLLACSAKGCGMGEGENLVLLSD